jgi:glycosyltransferase involved in cell wall biosynthesis
LKVAGWDQIGHQADLEALTERLNAQSSISIVGPQFGEAKASCFREASAFVLPSLSEGLPISVLEAWSWQLPVLMTPHCNLPEGVKAGAAIMASPNVESIAEGLRQLFSMSDSELLAMGKRGRSLVEKQFQWTSVAERMSQVYDWLLGCGAQPACVSI